MCVVHVWCVCVYVWCVCAGVYVVCVVCVRVYVGGYVYVWVYMCGVCVCGVCVYGWCVCVCGMFVCVVCVCVVCVCGVCICGVYVYMCGVGVWVCLCVCGIDRGCRIFRTQDGSREGTGNSCCPTNFSQPGDTLVLEGSGGEYRSLSILVSMHLRYRR